MTRTAHAVTCLSCALLGCGGPVKNVKFGTVSGIATTAEYRVVTEREGPNGKKIVCTEPSPDIALAVSRALETKANASVNDKVQAESDLRYQTAQALAQLGKRYATVQLLRDI